MTSSAIYGYAIVGRAGLANLLFPWARCENLLRPASLSDACPAMDHTQDRADASSRTRLPFLRRTVQFRFYVRGLRKWLIYHTSTKVLESQADALPQTARKTLVLFEGLGDMSNLFRPLLPHQATARATPLRDSLSTKSRNAIESHAIDYEIAVHIRKGDKPPISIDSPPPTTQWGWTLPNVWYINVIRSVRQDPGPRCARRVFSDGRPDQLADVLANAEHPTVGDKHGDRRHVPVVTGEDPHHIPNINVQLVECIPR